MNAIDRHTRQCPQYSENAKKHQHNVTIFARQYQCLRAPILSVPATHRRGDGGGGGGSEGGGSEGGGGEVGGSGGSSGGEDAAACQTCVQGTPQAE